MSSYFPDALPFAPGAQAHALGSSYRPASSQGQQNSGNGQPAGPTVQPTPADLVINQLAQATVANAQLQQENALIMKKMQQVLENMNYPKHKKITVSAPKSFDGKPKNYPAFISSLVTQFRADPATYSNPQSKVWYALSHMKDGIAELWARRMITAIEDNKYRITTWEDFESLMRIQFDSVNRKHDAQRNIATFKQGSKTAEEFFTQFEDFRADAGFGDEAIIYFLKEALNPGIVSKMVFMPNQPKTYDEYKEAAYFFDRQYRENKERNKPSSSANNTKPKQPSSTTTTTPPPTVPTVPTDVDNGTPMDVDRLRAMANNYPTITCYNCNRKGHYSSSCPEPRRKRSPPNTSSSATPATPSTGTTSSPRPKPEKTIRQMYDDLDAEEKSNFIRAIAEDFLPSKE